MDNTEYKGRWFLPSNINNKLYGVLKYTPTQGSILELFGEFTKNDFFKIEIIHGILSDGQYVTLYNSFLTSHTFNFSEGFGVTQYFVNFLIIGAHFDNKQNLAFNKVDIQFSFLDSWLDISKIEYEKTKDKKKITIKSTLPEDLTIQLSPKKNICFKNSHYLPKVEDKGIVTVQQFSFIEFNYKRKVKFKQLLEDISHIQNLFTLFIQRPIIPRTVKLSFKIGNNKKLYETNLFYSTLRPNEGKKSIHARKMLIPYKAIKPNFDSIIKKWVNEQDNLHTVFIPFFVSYFSNSSNQADKFLNLARAFEAFHKATINSNTVFFNQRIKDILQKYSKCYNNLLKIKSKVKFAKRIKDLRNLFTHSGPLEFDSLKHSLELHYYSERMQIILSCAILNYLGIDKTLIKNLVDNSGLYVHIKYKIK